MLDRLHEPALANAIESNDLSAIDALKQLHANGCGSAQHGFNLFNLFITTAHAADCNLTTLSGKVIPISNVKDCIEVLTSALIGQIYAVSLNGGQFSLGIKDGVVKEGEAFIELASDPIGLAKSLGGLIGELVYDPVGTGKKLGIAVVDGMQEKAYKHLEALDKGDYRVAGEQLAGLAIDVTLKVAAPAAGAALTTLKASPAMKQVVQKFGKGGKARSFDDIVKGLDSLPSTGGRTTQYQKFGGFSQANADFDALGLDNIRTIARDDGTIIRVGNMKDGTKVILRPNSSYRIEGHISQPTLELQRSDGYIKIRY